MEAGLANQSAALLLGSCPAQPQDSRLDSQAGRPLMDIQPAPVVDILDARLPLLAKEPAARGHQD